MQPEIAFGYPIEGTPPSADHVETVVQAYCKALSDGDLDGILALFSADVQFFDPVGQPARHGHDEVRAFFEPSAGKVELKTVAATRIAGFYAAVPMRARAHGFGVDDFFVDTLDVFTFDEAGKINQFYAFWGPTNNPSPDKSWD